MTEPYEQAEQIAAEWDRLLERAPHCDCCGDSVLNYETCLEIDGRIYCEKCVEYHTRCTEDMEEDY